MLLEEYKFCNKVSNWACGDHSIHITKVSTFQKMTITTRSIPRVKTAS